VGQGTKGEEGERTGAPFNVLPLSATDVVTPLAGFMIIKNVTKLPKVYFTLGDQDNVE